MRHLIWLSLLFIFYTFPRRHATHQLCRHDQMYALLQFKNTLTIDVEASSEYGYPTCHYANYTNYAYPKTISWNNKSGNNSNCCLWDGVTCDIETGHVIELDLSCSQLTGTINSTIDNGIFHLTHLQRLNLAHNNFRHSHISPAFGRFTKLTHLNLSYSSFVGSIPKELSFLSKLVSIDVSDNLNLSVKANDFDSLLKNLTHLKELVFKDVGISSNIPNSLMNLSSLEIIDLDYTNLHGILPGQIFMLPNLRELKLGSNNLTGDIPEINSTYTSSLQILDMGRNILFGHRGLPDSIGNLKSLRYLDLSTTSLVGKLPDSFWNLTSLTYLYLHKTSLAGELSDSFGNLKSLRFLSLSHTNLAGGLPDSFGNLKSLAYLDISQTSLAGEIPDSFGNLKSLKYLNLSDTSLAGELPDSFWNLKSLKYLDLSQTSLAGEIPDSFGNLKYLRYLDLSQTSLAGELPDSIGSLESLTTLQLYNCNLSGSIPKSIGNLTELTILDFSGNNFHSMPITISNLKKLYFLSLSKNHLNGTLPPRLFTIPSLLQLDISDNQFTGPIPDFPNESPLEIVYPKNNCLHGSIPHSIVNLVNLSYLSLSSNKLNGTVEPLLFSKFEYLDQLDLSHNFFQGSVPVLPVSLNYFIISHNQFSGLLPVLFGDIPSSICNSTYLRILDVSYNDFCGEIPQCLVKNNILEVLDLQKNRFSGTIPPISADELTTLNLNDNQFEGPIPESLSKCKKLELLDLGNNKLNGSFPHWLETFSWLQVLVLKSNKFHGPVGTSRTKSPYPNLRIFDLSDNQFIGLLPTRYFQDFTAMKNSKETEGGPTYMERDGYFGYKNSIAIVWNGVEFTFERILTTLATIDVSANNFEGQIPEALQELNSLRLLNLSHNSLTGPIPTSLGNLYNLQILDLSSNILTGTIPIQLGSITTLANLNVSYNHLVGQIPRGKQFNTFENNSYIENPGLCGLPLSNVCGDNKKPQSPKVIKQKEDQSIFSSGFTWKIVVFGYVCGVPFGLILGYLMFFVGWPRLFLGIAGPQNGRLRRRRNHM